MEDFGQLAGLEKEAKYDFSMEKIAELIQQHCSFPLVSQQIFWHQTLFSFLVGNEDLHAKNFSVLRKHDETRLSPMYDLACSTIEIRTKEELALPLGGKKSNFRRKDFIDYFGKTQLQLPDRVIHAVLAQLQATLPQWRELIAISFLSGEKKRRYLQLIEERAARLFA